MSTRYAPLPSNPSQDTDAQRELDNAFDDSDDEHDESTPLNNGRNSDTPSPIHSPNNTSTRQQHPGTYDFENVDYDFPPPGSPPPPSSVALPNQWGNTNGLVPESTPDRPASRANWFTRFVGLTPRLPGGAVGGGSNNDGVFSNVAAKPSAPVRVQDGDDTFLVPEDSRAEAPPSYTSAQADAVPPYWETTIHVPFGTDSSDLIIDSLPTGTLFSFMWNLLISMSFQFVGFLLTYLLHTTHAARLGSRAGLGVTLIQFGFALRRGGEDSSDTNANSYGWGNSAVPTYASTSPVEGNDGFSSATNSTGPGGMMTDEEANDMIAAATAEWLSFFLMTVGWFILLTSFLGFWRVKRWERGILNSQLENPHAGDRPSGDLPIVSQLERLIGSHTMAPGQFFRSGFGFRGSGGAEEVQRTEAMRSAEEGRQTDHQQDDQDARETDFMLPPNLDPMRDQEAIQGLLTEQRLQRDLRSAGFL